MGTNPIINLIYEDQDMIGIKMCIVVPSAYASIPSLHHIVMTFKSELDSLVEKVTAYIENEAKANFSGNENNASNFNKSGTLLIENIESLKSEYKDGIDEVQEPYIIPIKKKVRIRGGKKEMCSKCSKFFTPEYLQKWHQCIVNNLETSDASKSKEIGHKCPQCGKLFINLLTLRIHIKNLHSGMIFMCDICDYQGKSKTLLKEHMARHGEKEKVPCKSCGKSIFKGDLRRHHRLYHDENWQKMIPCPVCGKEFKKKQLPKHMKSVHAKRTYECDLCEYKARDKYNLRLHVSKMHLGVKDLPKEKCQYCDSETTNLKHHIQKNHRDL